MNAKEFYDIVGDYSEVLSRLMNDSLIIRFAKKFKDDPSFNNLVNAHTNKDGQSMFKSTHTLKGVAGNMAFTKLYEYSNKLCDMYRSCQDSFLLTNEAESLYKKIVEEYGIIISNIDKLD